MMKTNKKVIRKILLIIAILGIIGSVSYLAYEFIWMPFSIERRNEQFKVDETNTQADTFQSSTPEIQEKYVEIKSQYKDFAGKFIVKGLNMDFPVMQTDNNSYYLKYTIDGKEDKHGALFVDYRNDLISLDQNTIIYGHNMVDGTQFGMLNSYKKLSTYKACPVITFNTLYKDYKWKIFASFLINTKPEDDNGYVFNYLRTNFKDENEFNEFYNEVLQRSYFKTSVDVNFDDKILTMSTCSTAIEDSRFVVMARLVRDGESESVDVSSATVNENQKFPEIYQ